MAGRRAAKVTGSWPTLCWLGAEADANGPRTLAAAGTAVTRRRVQLRCNSTAWCVRRGYQVAAHWLAGISTIVGGRAAFQRGAADAQPARPRLKVSNDACAALPSANIRRTRLASRW